MTSTLLVYLCQRFPPPHIEKRSKSASTTSENFASADITNVQPWSFSPDKVCEWFPNELNREQQLPDFVSGTISPQEGNFLKVINNEQGVVSYYNRTHYVALNRALAKVVNAADTEAYAFPADRNGIASNGRRTLVGEIKPSWIFRSSFDEPSRHQVLAQLLFYMQSFEMQYGYLLTDRELIAVKRDTKEGVYGSLFCSEPVFQDGILLALWGLHMLAYRDSHREMLVRPRPPGYTRPDRDPDYADE